MGVGSALLKLGGFLEECERRKGVLDVETVDRVDLAEPGRAKSTVHVTLDLTRSNGDASLFTAHDTELGEDGSLTFDVASTRPVLPDGDDDVAVDPLDARFEPNGTAVVTLSLSVADDEVSRSEAQSGSATPEKEGPSATRHDRDVPPFEDTELLLKVYESCDTFREMADELGMDVTAETVRRYMVDHGIHEPNSYDTGRSTEEERDRDDVDRDPTTEPDPDEHGDDEGTEPDTGDRREPPTVRADGIGLPEDVTVETLIETVRGSNTIYEFKREVGLEREDALDVLRDLHLLEFFTGRLDSHPEREITREEVVERLREASARQ